MRGFVLAGAAVLACAQILACNRASAQTALTQPVSDSVASLGSIHLRLPAGQWQPVADSETQAYFNGGGLAQTPNLHRLYVQTEGGRVSAILTIETDGAQSTYGWTPARICARKDTYWSDHRNGWTNNYDCALVNHVVMRESSKTAGLMKAAYDAARTAGGMPRQLVRADFADAYANHQVFVSVAFNPELAGLSPTAAGWKTSEWQSANADAAHKAYLDRVAAWAASYRTVVRAALP